MCSSNFYQHRDLLAHTLSRSSNKNEPHQKSRRRKRTKEDANNFSDYYCLPLASIELAILFAVIPLFVRNLIHVCGERNLALVWVKWSVDINFKLTLVPFISGRFLSLASISMPWNFCSQIHSFNCESGLFVSTISSLRSFSRSHTHTSIHYDDEEIIQQMRHTISNWQSTHVGAY